MNMVKHINFLFFIFVLCNDTKSRLNQNRALLSKLKHESLLTSIITNCVYLLINVNNKPPIRQTNPQLNLLYLATGINIKAKAMGISRKDPEIMYKYHMRTIPTMTLLNLKDNDSITP